MSTSPLENPLHEVFAIETADGVEPSEAWVLIQEPQPDRDAVPAQRRSRVVRKAMQTINDRIDFLGAIQAGPERGSVYLRNARALAELRWCRGVIENGGTVPPKWFADE